jgi:ABC-type nitrate/sulfonate/bicarbonate transport system permease component
MTAVMNRISRLGGLLGVVILLVVWTVLALTVFSGKSVPTPWAVLVQVHKDGWSFYWPHIKQTGTEAIFGYLIGNLLAFGCALLVVLLPFTESVVMQLAVASYCMPIMAVGPILTLVFSGNRPMIALAGLSVFFTTLVGILLGLRSADRTSLDLVTAYGGGRWQQTTKVRLKSALPSTIAALKIAAPAALLGAIIGEYLGNLSQGLGVAMTVSQQQLEAARTWSLALLAGLLAAGAYGLTGLLARVVTPWADTTPGVDS